MNQNKKVWILSLITIFIFIFALGIFPLSMYLETLSGEYDFYSMFGFLAMVLLFPISIVLGFITFRIWLSERNKTLELFKDL